MPVASPGCREWIWMSTTEAIKWLTTGLDSKLKNRLTDWLHSNNKNKSLKKNKKKKRNKALWGCFSFSSFPLKSSQVITRGLVSQSGFFVSYNLFTATMTLSSTSFISSSEGELFCFTNTMSPVTMRSGCRNGTGRPANKKPNKCESKYSVV